MENFEAKVAVITGAASGIGKALSKRCLAEGMNVVMADIEADALEAARIELSAAGSNSIITQITNVAIEEEIQALADRAIKEFGSVDLLFNNAGVGAGGNTWETSVDEWEWIMGVNLWSVIYGVKIFVPLMTAQDTECHIVNTASVAGLLGGVTNACYSVTKHGVVALTENLYTDLKNQSLKIGASVLCPGFVNTNIFDSGRNKPANLKTDAKPANEEQQKLLKTVLEQGMTPDTLADIVFQGIRAETLYLLTHDDFADAIKHRAENITTGTNPVITNFTGE